MDELMRLARVWDRYDASVDAPRPMPHWYPALRFWNWWGSGATFEQLHDLARTHGIPVARVPPATVLRALVNAGSAHQDKLDILVAEEDSIRAACHEGLDIAPEHWEGDYRNHAEVARLVLAAWDDGHLQAAACLALAGAEDLMFLVANVDRGQKYAGLTKAAGYAPMEWLLDPQWALAPVETLFSRYFPERNDPIPEKLSRHAVLHRLPLSHLSNGHSIVAIMLMVSLLRQAQQDAIEAAYEAEAGWD